MKVTPSLLDFLISPSTGQLWSYLQLPDLSTGKVWVGDENNRPVESDFSPLGSYLPFNQVFRGNEDNVATPYPTILLQNLPDLGVATITGLDLPAGKIWRGTESNRPEESDALSLAEADIVLLNLRFLTGHFVMNNDGGNPGLRILMPFSQWLSDLGVGMTQLLPGGIFAIAVPGIDYVTPAQLDEAVSVLQDEIDALQVEIDGLQGQIDAINAEIVVINGEIDAIQAELVVIEADIAALQADVLALQAAVAALEDQVDAILAELVVINDEIDAIQAELVVIEADIATIQAQIITIFAQLDTMEAEIAALAAAVAAISIDIDIVFGDIDELQDEIDDLQNQINELRDAIISMEAQIDALTDIVLSGFDTIFADLIALGEEIANLTVTLEGDVSGTGLISGPIETTINLTLDQIPIASNNVDIGGHRIINAQDPIDTQDLTTKGWVLAELATIPGTTDITLEGDVSGSGPLSSPVITTLNLTLDEIPTAISDVSVGGHKITHLAPGSAGTDAVNVNMLSDAISSLDVALEGFVEGGPAVSGVIETVRGPDCLLTNIPAGGDVDMGNYKIENLSMSSAVPKGESVNSDFIWNILNGDVYVEWAA